MIETTAQLEDLLQQSNAGTSEPVCAIDTEADSLHRYRESLCLIQFDAGGNSVLIDPLAIQDLSPLWNYLSQATVWMHGADYDMTMVKRECGALPPVVLDTQIGARLLGVRRFGLVDLVKEYFSVELSKSSQKADWGKRPLSDKMVEYALNDVRFLLEMGEVITTRLKELGRHDWFIESCEAARLRVLERDDSNEMGWRVSGSGKLNRFGLACLRALWQWRDAEAESWDKPSFMVATNRKLLEWSSELSGGKNIKLPHHYRPDRVKRIRSAVAALETLPESDWPNRISKPRRKRDRNFDKLVDEMIAKREKVAEELGIDGSLIATRASLESIAAKEATPGDILLTWQLECLQFD